MATYVQTIDLQFGRKATPRRINLGMEGENLITRVEFILPQIAEEQTATLMYPGKYANAVMLNPDQRGRWYILLTKEIIGANGELEGYVQIDGSGGEVWKSAPLRMVTGDVPNAEVEIDQRFPTAVETMLAEIAGHREDMTETLQRAEDAAKRAEDAAANAGQGGGGTAAQKAVLYTEQSLTEEQKAQARKNIAVYSIEEVDALIPEETDLSGYYTKEETDAAIEEATAEGQWELIEFLNIQEETTGVVRTVYPDGNGTALNLSAAKVIVKFYYPIVGTIGTRVDFKTNGTALGDIVMSIAPQDIEVTTYRSTALYQIKPVAGVYEFIGASGTQGGAMSVIYPPNGQYQAVSAENKITEIAIVAWLKTLPAGTTIEIWGVRA